MDSASFFGMQISSFLPKHLLKRWSFPHLIILDPYKKSFDHICKGLFIQGPSVIFHLSIYLSLHQYQTVIISFAVSFKIINYDSLALFFFSTVVLAVPGLLRFHVDCKMDFSISANNVIEIFIRIGIESMGCFR